MSDAAKKALEIYAARVGIDDLPGEFHLIDQAQIDAFAELTHDHQYIHVDPERARRETPFGVTIAHGFLSLSMLTYLLRSIPRPNPDPLAGATLVLNYGCDRLRFPSPVKVGSRIRAHRRLMSAELKDGNAIQLKNAVTIEIEGQAKPACAAEWLTRVIY